MWVITTMSVGEPKAFIFLTKVTSLVSSALYDDGKDRLPRDVKLFSAANDELLYFAIKTSETKVAN